jgi:hypothetical protein
MLRSRVPPYSTRRSTRSSAISPTARLGRACRSSPIGFDRTTARPSAATADARPSARAESWDDRTEADRLPCVVAELGPRLFKSRLGEAEWAVGGLPAEPLLSWPLESRAAPLLGLASFEAAALGEELDFLSDLQAESVPPDDPSKFPNKWRKMERDAPCRTLMAHLGKDTYSHIHFDSEQARTISVREAARLQSFPDGFRLEGRTNVGFRQVGNAAPLLSFALARSVTKTLGLSVEEDGALDI